VGPTSASRRLRVIRAVLIQVGSLLTYASREPNQFPVSGQPAGGSSGEGEAAVPPAPYPFPPPAESYYPYFYPPNFAPHPHEAQGNGDGTSAHPMPPPVFPLHPAVYPPYAQYPHPGVPYPPPAGTPATAAPADLNGKSADTETNGEASSSRKKSSRTSKIGDDGKKKKGKDIAAGSSNTNGHTETPVGQPGSPAEAAYTTSGSHGGMGNGTEHRHVVSPV
jgi:neural Wiskott-Aldrich syndrome protein